VAKRLRLNGFECEFIMGDLPQVKRLKIINDIKAGKIRLLVATDVAARGLDIEGLALVVNYDLPNESENYVHRIGRTARAGKTGLAITLSSEQDVYELPGIERYIGKKIPSETVTAELLAEDKSEGKHIQTDYYEERGRKTEGSRNEGHSRGRRDHERRKDGRGSGAKENERGKRRDRHDASKEQNRNTNAKAHTSAASEKHGSPVKLSELSLEERMAYYKQKYDKSESAKAPRKDTGRRKRWERDSVPAASGEAKGRNQKERHKKHDSKQEKSARQEISVNNTGAPDQAASQDTAKKGVLSRILGVFRKK
jgi:ATP-dependent RNA helicase RhlB